MRVVIDRVPSEAEILGFLAQIDDPRFDAKKLKCSSGNKQCGERCVPVEQKCKSEGRRNPGNSSATSFLAGASVATGSFLAGQRSRQKESSALARPVETKPVATPRDFKRDAAILGLGTGTLATLTGLASQSEEFRFEMRVQKRKLEGMLNLAKSTGRGARRHGKANDKLTRKIIRAEDEMEKIKNDLEQTDSKLGKAKVVIDRAKQDIKKVVQESRSQEAPAQQTERQKVASELKQQKTAKGKIKVIRDRAKSDLKKVLGKNKNEPRTDGGVLERYDKKLNCKPGNKQCGGRCVPKDQSCADEKKKKTESSKKTGKGLSPKIAAAIATGVVGSSYAGLVYGPALFANGVVLMGGLSDSKLSKDFVNDPRFNPDAIKAGALRKIGEGAFGRAFLDEENGIIYKEAKSAGEAARGLKRQGKPLSFDPIASYLKSSVMVNLGKKNEHVAQYVAGELNVGPKLIGRKGNIIAQEFLEGFSVVKGNIKNSEAGAVGKKAMESLSALHLSGIAHNDVHSENMMIRRGKAGGIKDLKFIDFGMASVGNFQAVGVEAARLSIELMPGKKTQAAVEKLKVDMVANAFSGKQAQRQTIINFYEDLGLLDRSKKPRLDSLRVDSKRLKCSPGNKQCGDRCIPAEQDCRKGRGKRPAQNKTTRSLVTAALIAGGSAGVLALRNPKQTAAFGRMIADRAFAKRVIESAPPEIQSKLNRGATFGERFAQFSRAMGTANNIVGTASTVVGIGASVAGVYQTVRGANVEAAQEQAEQRVRAVQQHAQEQINTLVNQEREKYEAESARITQELTQVKDQFEETSRQQKQAIEDLTSQTEQLSGQVAQKTQELDLLKSQSAELNKQLKLAKTQNRDLDLENQTLADANRDKTKLARELQTNKAELSTTKKALAQAERQQAELVKQSQSKLESLQAEMSALRQETASKVQSLKNSRDTAIAKLQQQQADKVAEIEQQTTQKLDALRSEMHQATMLKLTEQREQMEIVARERVELAQMPKATRPGTLINTKTGINLTASARQGLPLVVGDGGLGLENFNQRTDAAVRRMIERKTQEDLAVSYTQFRNEITKVAKSGSSAPKTMWGRYNAALLVQERREGQIKDNAVAIRTQYAQQMQELNRQLFEKANAATEFTPELLRQYDVQAAKLHKKFLSKLKQSQDKVPRVIVHNWKQN